MTSTISSDAQPKGLTDHMTNVKSVTHVTGPGMDAHIAVGTSSEGFPSISIVENTVRNARETCTASARTKDGRFKVNYRVDTRNNVMSDIGPAQSYEVLSIELLSKERKLLHLLRSHTSVAVFEPTHPLSSGYRFWDHNNEPVLSDTIRLKQVRVVDGDGKEIPDKNNEKGAMAVVEAHFEEADRTKVGEGAYIVTSTLVFSVTDFHFTEAPH